MNRLSIIGAGSAGAALIQNLKIQNYDVVVGLRSPDKFEGSVSIEAAIESSDIIVMALPFDAGLDVIQQNLEGLKGKIIIDMMNPLLADFSGYRNFDGLSGAEVIQGLSDEFHVVKAFNHVLAPSIADPQNSIQFIIGNHQESVDTVTKIATSLSFNAQPLYDLTRSREVEALAYLWINFTIMVKNNPMLRLKVEGKEN